MGENNVPSGRLGIGVDIGSTATKVAVVGADGSLVHAEVMPTGFSSVDAAERARAALEAALDARPDNTLAGLLVDGLDRGLPPERLRRVAAA